MTVPYSFANATVSIPLSQLDANFNTPITLGNTAIQLGNTVTTLNNMTLANVTISSGNVTITNVSVTTANVTTLNATTVIATTANVTTANITTGNVTNMSSGNVTITGGSINGTTLGATTASTANVTTLTTSSTVTINGGTANGVAYLNGSKVLTTGSALTFDGTTFSGTTNAALAKVPGSVGWVSVGDNNTGASALRLFGGATQKGWQIGSNLTVANALEFALATAAGGTTFTDQQMILTSTGLGIGTSSPAYKLDVSGYIRGLVNNSSVGNASSAQFTQNGTGDAAISFLIGSTTEWLAGVDNSDSDSFKISNITGGSDFTTTGLTLTTSGNLGIGTSSPIARLTVSDSSNPNSGTMTLGNNATFNGTIQYLIGPGELRISQVGSGSLGTTFYTNGSEAMRLTSTSLYTASGINVGIGTSSPTRKLQVSSSLSTTGNEEVVYFGGANAVSAGGLSITNYFETGTATSANRRVDLQSKDKDGNLRDMVLQPSGGNLGLGIADPGGYRLNVRTAPATNQLDGTYVSDGTRIVVIGQSGATYNYAGIAANENVIYSSANPLNIVADAQFIKFSTGTERARITSDGTLLVGKTSSNNGTNGAQLSPTNQFFTNTNDYIALFNRKGTDGISIYFQKDETNVGTLDVTSTGITLTGTNGITFTASQVASSNANTLDDYEEGTWTATLTDGTNTTTSTGANYRKIGSLVFLSFQFYDKDISAWNAANLSVTGLPFTVATNHDSFVTVGTPNGFTVSGPLAMLFSNGSTSSGLYYRGGSSNYVGVQKGDITNNSNFSLYLSACYTAS